MLGIDPEVISHKLSVYPSYPPVKQNKEGLHLNAISLSKKRLKNFYKLNPFVKYDT